MSTIQEYLVLGIDEHRIFLPILAFNRVIYGFTEPFLFPAFWKFLIFINGCLHILDMAICTRTGCGKTFDESNNNAGDCMFHPGGLSFPIS